MLRSCPTQVMFPASFSETAVINKVEKEPYTFVLNLGSVEIKIVHNTVCRYPPGGEGAN